jgi:alkylhydroperoxidase family enzyme
MEHAEARELLEIAAVEPGGFDRLAAGDTSDAAALASHIAGCDDCAAELERLRRAAAVIREAVRMAPPADLRDRTLAYVAAVGRPRGAAASPTVPDRTDIRDARRTASGGRLWVLAAAAAVVVAIVGTSIFVAQSRDSLIETQARQINALAKVATWSLRIDGEPDATYVELEGTETAGPDVNGTLAFSPGTKELVVLAQGLAEPAAGMQYRCWVEIDGGRRRIGQMFFGGDVAYWVGPVEAITRVGPGTRFGVSLVPAEGDSVATDPILEGQL